MSEILLVRHGVTEWNSARRMQGRADLPITEASRAWLARRAPPPAFAAARWHSSPLTRATQTARLLGARALLLDERLVEMDWGAWEGLTLAQMRAEDEQAMRANEARGLDFRPRGGESPRDVAARLRPWFERIADDEQDVVAVSHKGVIRSAIALATGWDMRADFAQRVDWHAAHRFRAERRAGAVTISLVTLNMALAAR